MERTKEEFKKQMSKIFMGGILLAMAFLMTGVGSAFSETICLTNCKGDFDNDSDVDGSDLAVFSADFGRTDCLDIEKVVTVTSPNDGETIVKGYQDYTIWWNVNSTLSSNPDNEVKITYCPTFGSNQSCQIIIETTKSQNGSYGYYSWSVPASLENGTYKIAVISLGYGTDLSDMSDADFNVVSLDITPSITVTSPNGGESFKKGLSYNISWETEGTIPNFGISLQDSNNLGRSIVSIDGDNSVNSHTYSWLVDEDLPSGQYKLRVSGTDYSNATDISDNYFSIVDSSTSSSITITSPNSEEE
ncbi:MAG: hypothetical protein KAI67_01680 [Candidatus Pacebacteria bacterium]|nr:hypothetical protein [Candidatus Paceibacterota bacterium]